MNHTSLLKSTLTLVLFWMLTVSGVLAQELPGVDIRFANPVFRHTDRTFSVDVEMKTREKSEALFGANVRFFFDASVLTFKSFHDFQPGYAVVGEGIQSFTGNPSSGPALFNFNGAASYINGSVQLTDERFPLDLYTTKWVKVFTASFYVPKNITGEESFCPGMVWDQKAYGKRGGFLGGSDGVIITILERQRDTRQETLPTQAFGNPFNWQYHAEPVQPFGQLASTECISIAELVSTEDLDHVDGAGFALFQNQPNPFDDQTTIEFIVPRAQDADLIFFDADGKILEAVKGHYEAGRNQVLLKLKPWMNQSNVFYYRLQTDTYTSKARSLNVIRA